MLELLLQRTGEVLPRSLISSLVWNMNFDSDTNVIDVAVRRLRSKIDDDFEPKLIDKFWLEVIINFTAQTSHGNINHIRITVKIHVPDQGRDKTPG